MNKKSMPSCKKINKINNNKIKKTNNKQKKARRPTRKDHSNLKI